LISTALSISPQVPVKNIDGTWGGGDLANGADRYVPVNPIAIASLKTSKDVRRKFTGGGNIQINLIKGLIFRTSVNTSLDNYSGLRYSPKYEIGWAINTVSEMRDFSSFNTWWSLNELLQYSKQLGDHYLEAMASHEAQAYTWRTLNGARQGFLTDDVFDLNAGDASTASNDGGHGDGSKDSYLGRLVYNYAERYMLTGSVRWDGSSRFGQNNRWGTFPAVSTAWRISKESWYTVGFMNEAKLRLEWGTTGNEGGGGIYSPLRSGATEWGTGFLPNNYSNPNLKWESTTTYNAGFNLGFLQNRIQIEGDIYKKNTDNLLMPNPLPAYMGVQGTGSIGTPTVNIGALENIGWGISINSTNIDTKDFTWSSNFNISGFRTEITKLYSNTARVLRTAWWMGDFQQVSEIGKAPWQFLGYVYDGLYQSLDDIANSAVPVDNSGNRLPVDQYNGIWVGDVKYRDISGPDGKPDGIIDINDQTTIGSPWPKLFGGFTNTFSYKGFELNVLLTFTQGNDIYNRLAMQNSKTNEVWSSRNLLINAFNYAKPVTNPDGSVTLENPNTNIPRITDTDLNGNWNRFSTRWMEDGSFIRVKNISLSYRLPKTLMSKTKYLKDIRLSLSAQNMLTFTKYKGYDPEVGAYVGQNVYNDSQTIGVDAGHYPLTPIYTFTVNVNL
jgi:TonB-linked SusC/RagA family outer membrane protein